MQRILTPTGYRDITDILPGDEVCAFDMVTGDPVVNVVETVQWVNYAEWARWWQVEPTVPPFTFYKINDTWTLNSEQSIWRNGTNVCHARHLVVGDEIYDDDDNPVIITSIEEVEADGWWRFDISGDHSYIVEGLTLHNASRFWVLGTGTWDASDTTHWAASSGAGSGGQSVPGSADTVTFDGSSGGGTVTPNTTITVQSITCGAHTGTLAFNTNNNNVTLSSSTGFNSNNSGTRTLNLGNGTWTLTINSGATPWSINASNLTFNANSSVIKFSATTASKRTFDGANLTYATLSIDANTSGGFITVTSNSTFATLTISAPNCFGHAGITVTNALTVTGSSSAICTIISNTPGQTATLTCTNGATLTWCAIRDVTFTGTCTATNSFDCGHNSGITITAPSTGGGGVSRSRAFAGMA